MIRRSEEEIIEFVTAVWMQMYKLREEYCYDAFKVEVEIYSDSDEQYYDISISNMYECPVGYNLEAGITLAKFFGTTNIQDRDTFGHGGCETCDFGSKYGFTLRVSPSEHNTALQNMFDKCDTLIEIPPPTLSQD